MKPRSLTTTITTGIWIQLAIAVVILGLFMAFQFWHLVTTKEIAEKILHTETEEREWRELGEDLVDAETGQRGYLLTGDERYLEPYRDVVGRITHHLEKLRRLDDNPHFHDNIVQTERIVHAKLMEMAETIELKEQGKYSEALFIVKGNRGKQLMDEFRRLRLATLDLELRSLNKRREEFLNEINHTLPAIVFVGVVAMGFLVWITFRTSRRLRQPITSLLDGIQDLSLGDLARRVPVSSHDEIGRLASAFNKMADALQEAHKERDVIMQELQRSNVELDGFAYVASHDLKAPLRGIRNLADWISEDLGQSVSAETAENLTLLRGRADRLDSLLEGMLEYSRAGRRNELIEKVDLEKLVWDIAHYISPREGFTVEVDGGMSELVTYRVPLEKVLRNLIGNALKHHDGRTGKVIVSEKDLGNFIEISVADDGPGIPVQFQEKIFQMFQTLKPRDQVEGSGMGLAIVKKTVESVAGQVCVDSNPPKRGAIFSFTWPKILSLEAGS